MRRRLFRAAPLVLALTAGLVLSVTAPAADTTATARDRPPEVSLRMATYNIAAGRNADQTFDLATTVDQLRSLDADVVALQEVDRHWAERSEWRDLVGELGESLGMHTAFAPIYSLDPVEPGAPRREYGLALLSRFPITAVDNHELTRKSTVFPDLPPGPMPGFLEATLQVGGTSLHVYNTHLDFAGDPTLREIEVAETLEILAADGDGTPQILAGDYNAQPGDPELDPLWGPLRDGWTEARRTTGGPMTYPAPEPVKRIDIISVTPDIRVRTAAVPTDPAAAQASDHRPVVMDLRLPRTTPHHIEWS